jgi:hypothetical protein
MISEVLVLVRGAHDDCVVAGIHRTVDEERNRIPLFGRRFQPDVAVRRYPLAVQDDLDAAVLFVEEDRAPRIVIDDHADASPFEGLRRRNRQALRIRGLNRCERAGRGQQRGGEALRHLTPLNHFW